MVFTQVTSAHVDLTKQTRKKQHFCTKTEFKGHFGLTKLPVVFYFGETYTDKQNIQAHETRWICNNCISPSLLLFIKIRDRLLSRDTICKIIKFNDLFTDH